MRSFRKYIQNDVVLFCSLLLNGLLFTYICISSTCVPSGLTIRQFGRTCGNKLCEKFDQIERMKPDDLSSARVYDEMPNEWDVCDSMKKKFTDSATPTSQQNTVISRQLKYCSFDPTVEQRYQRNFFSTFSSCSHNKFSPCVLLPPKDYKWPKKQVTIPLPENEPPVYWSNLGVNSSKDLIAFNPEYPKNIHHFNAALYDIEQENYVNLAAKYIPFATKIRTMLDIGAGGGSISFILNKRYDVTVLNTALPDFPYCEYINERGGLCALLDGAKPLPFAKFSFDIIHHSWVFHSSTAEHWIKVLLDQTRILRPGGYLWIKDGFSFKILAVVKFLLLEKLGYKVLYEAEAKKSSKLNIRFGQNPYQMDWEAILMKPISIEKDVRDC